MSSGVTVNLTTNAGSLVHASTPGTLTMTATVSDDGLPEPRERGRGGGRGTLPTFERNPDGPTLPINVPQLQSANRSRPTRTRVERVTVTWTQVRRVTYLDQPRTELHGLRAPGTGLPGVVYLGTWRTWERKTFVAAYRHDPGYVIDLEGHDFDRLIVSGERVPFLESAHLDG